MNKEVKFDYLAYLSKFKILKKYFDEEYTKQQNDPSYLIERIDYTYPQLKLSIEQEMIQLYFENSNLLEIVELVYDYLKSLDHLDRLIPLQFTPNVSEPELPQYFHNIIATKIILQYNSFCIDLNKEITDWEDEKMLLMTRDWIKELTLLNYKTKIISPFKFIELESTIIDLNNEIKIIDITRKEGSSDLGMDPIGLILHGDGISSEYRKYAHLYNLLDKVSYPSDYLTNAKVVVEVTIIEEYSYFPPTGKYEREMELILNTFQLIKPNWILLGSPMEYQREIDLSGMITGEKITPQLDLSDDAIYQILKDEEEDFVEKWNEIYAKLKSSNKYPVWLRRYFDSYKKEFTDDAFLDLCITLDGIFGSSQEVSHKIRVRCANFLESEYIARKKLMNEVKKIYTKRSKIAHGDYYDEISLDELIKLRKIMNAIIFKIMKTEGFELDNWKGFKNEFHNRLDLKAS